MENIDVLNQRLADVYGKYDDGRPRYRLVWANDQREMRKDSFNVFYGNLFLRREENVVAEHEKYPFARDKWILEKLVFENFPPNLVNVFNGSYECIWAFRGKGNTYIHPNWLVLSFLISAAEGRIHEKMTPGEIDEEEAKQLAEEIEAFETEFDNDNRTPLFAQENAVAISNTKMWEK